VQKKLYSFICVFFGNLHYQIEMTEFVDARQKRLRACYAVEVCFALSDIQTHIHKFCARVLCAQRLGHEKGWLDIYQLYSNPVLF